MTSKPQLDQAEDTCERVKSVLQEEVARVRTPEDAERVLQRAEALAAAKTEAEAGERATQSPASAPGQIERAQRAAPVQPAGAADALVETAAQAVAEVPGASAVVEGAQKAVGTDGRAEPVPSRVRHGRSLLRQAVLRRMGPIQALDARLYLEINGLPHPDWLDTVCKAVTRVTTGGWIWIGGTLVAYWLGVPRGGEALRAVVPGVVVSTWLAEYPAKAYFRRQRPFIDVVRALVVGKAPGSWSFPSGHTCAAFAAAWMLTRTWPEWRGVFFGVAATLGCSRVFVGAHYPGDVATGAVLGVSCSELVWRVVRLLPGSRFGR